MYCSFRDQSTITHVPYIKTCSHKLSLLAILTNVSELYKTDKKPLFIKTYGSSNSDNQAQQLN